MSMTHEEAARILDPETSAKALSEYGDGSAQIAACDEACRIAANVLRNKPTGKQLTLEQLREMDGRPVWVHVIDHTIFADKKDDFDGWGMCRKSWVRIWDSKRADIVHIDYDFEDYGKDWIAYAYHPAHIDREAWEKPCSMCGGKTTLYQHTNTTKLFMNTFGNAARLVTECMACPPYADCCMKGISANSAFKIKFCPECGRPLTEEAWAELEKRIIGLLKSCLNLA